MQVPDQTDQFNFLGQLEKIKCNETSFFTYVKMTKPIKDKIK